MDETPYNPWPLFDYPKFQSTGYLLHMAMQLIGKLKLATPFEPHWANVPIWLTTRGLTTGIIPYERGAYSINIDLIDHSIKITTQSGQYYDFKLHQMSVAQFADNLLSILRVLNINIPINPMPQEIPNPIAFDKDLEQRYYDEDLANVWWRILLSTYCVLRQYRAHFDGENPGIGLMWGTFDLRDARYNGVAVPTTGINAGYIRRNAMNEGQVEAGWWAGSEAYPQPAFFSFTYPQPAGIENAKIQPAYARWDAKMAVFILDYADLLKSPHPEQDLLDFFNSTYRVGTELAGWDSRFLTSGKPI